MPEKCNGRQRFGLISADSHAQLARDAFTSRMSARRWAGRIPEVREVMQGDQLVERWVVDGAVVGMRGVANCAAAMGDPLRRTVPQRWEEVPRKVYDPAERLKALDDDGIDGEVLFFNDPIDSMALPFASDAEFELACVQAYNDALAEWREVSRRYVPLALIPYLSDIQTVVGEVERAVGRGHRGIVLVAEPSMAHHELPHFNDPHWYPLWEACEALEIPVHWHAHAGIRLLPSSWASLQALRRTAAFSVQPQFVPNLILSGIADRYPRLNWVCAETGAGWLAYVMDACDHIWERQQLWREQVATRPSDVFRRQVHVTFWYEKAGLATCRSMGLDNLMWASDYPHGTSTFPESWDLVEQVMTDVPAAERERLLFWNAARLYHLE